MSRHPPAGMFRLRPLLLALGLVVLLALLARSDRSAAAPSAPALLGSPTFRESDLEDEAALWYDRFRSALDSPYQYPDARDSAASGDLYQLGRFVNVHVSTLLAVFRSTGDLRLLDEMDPVMEAARAELRDTNGDGYRNWRWLHDPANAQWYGDDRHVMDEAMTHGLIAAVAWAYQVNRDLASPGGIEYGERADFWTRYLLDDFEPKWQGRENARDGYDYIHVELMHPYLQLVRYFHYLGLLTGDPGYTAEAAERAAVLTSEFREVDSPFGPARVWGQGVQAAASYVGYLQPTIYAGYTVLALYELGLEGVDPIADASFLSQIATTLVSFVIGDRAGDFAVDVGGHRERAGFEPAPLAPADPWGFAPMTEEQYAIQAFGVLAPYDGTGTLRETAARLYLRLEEPGEPRRIYAPATLFLAQAGDGFGAGSAARSATNSR